MTGSRSLEGSLKPQRSQRAKESKDQAGVSRPFGSLTCDAATKAR
jgi:ribosomal protein L34E